MDDVRVKAKVGKQVYVDAPDSHEIGGAAVISWNHDTTVTLSLLGNNPVVATKLEIGGFHEFTVDLQPRGDEEDWL